MSDPVPGQLRGVGLRLDPQGILFRSYDEGGLRWGYTLKPEEGQPMIFMDGEWTEFVPQGVWLQMLELWNEMLAEMKNNINDVQEYLEYPEIANAIS
jgi:hypothetical protein